MRALKTSFEDPSNSTLPPALDQEGAALGRRLSLGGWWNPPAHSLAEPELSEEDVSLPLFPSDSLSFHRKKE